MRTKIAKIFLLGALASATVSSFAIDITGAGASFPAPVYSKWAEAYQKQTGNKVNYASIGSSGGIKQIREKTVDFGATDAPLKGDALDKDGMVQFPAIIGGVVAVVNLPGFKPGELKLDGETLANIFNGDINNWNAAQIAAVNPGKKLPDQAITVVTRSDGSGTTAVFTDYLTKANKRWADSIGSGAIVKWPALSTVGGKGNEGVSANVSRVKGSIGYVEYAYAKLNKMTTLQLKNLDGKFVSPSLDSFKAAAAGANWSSTPGMGISMTNQPGANSWPIAAASFILMYKDPANKEKSSEAIKFFEWAFKNGASTAVELEYVPLPANVTDYIAKNVWSNIAK
ncbi:MAG: phosphate ABC transporter substrate-binding protein PstS [Betaproteobacteria bacterium]|jgi:phosphate transport system substrate-binding protein